MTKRQKLGQEVFAVFGGGEGLEKLGAKRIEMHDEGVFFVIERDGITIAAVTIGKQKGAFTLYFKHLGKLGGATSYKELQGEELKTALMALLKHYAPEPV